MTFVPAALVVVGLAGFIRFSYLRSHTIFPSANAEGSLIYIGPLGPASQKRFCDPDLT